MTDKITLGSISSFQNDITATTQYNANNALVTTAFNNTLSRDGTSPNQMFNNLDMNSNQIINLPQPLTATSALRLQDLNTFIGGGTLSSIPIGGTTNQVLIKLSNTDFNVGWASVPVLSVPNTWTALNTFSNSVSISGTLTVNGAFIDNTGGVTAPTVKLTGSSSGTITVQPQAAAGTYNFNLPTTAGTAGNYLASGGGGASPMTWASFPVPGIAGTIIASNGSSWIASTATYPISSTINQILYSSAANTITGLASAGNAVLATNVSNVPSLLTSSNSSFLSANSSGVISWSANSARTPQVTVFTTGSGTYTTPAGAVGLLVEILGGGGGGAGSGTTPGTATAGGNTTFGTSLLTANGGAAGTNTNGVAGTGGTSTGGDINITGGASGAATALASAPGGNGGNSIFSGGGQATAATGASNGSAAVSNTGGGGAGAGNNAGGTGSGSGGGAGGYCRKLLSTPLASYAYGVGAAGSGATAGTGGGSGGPGSLGIISVTAYF